MAIKELPAGDWRLQVYGTRISGNDRRRKPRVAERNRAIHRQGNRCLYCEIPVGTKIWRGSRTVILQPHWDHFVPYVYAQRNDSTNWVLACHVCNAIKTARIFSTVQEAREAILPARAAKGYESPESALQRLDAQPSAGVVAPTGRQLAVLRLIARGLSPDQVVDELGMRNRGQFQSLVDRACSRLGVEGLGDAVRVAGELGYVVVPGGSPCVRRAS